MRSGPRRTRSPVHAASRGSRHMFPEEWELMHAGTDPDLRLPVAYVARRTHDVEDRLIVFKLIKRLNGFWYNYGQFLSLGRFRVTDDPRSDRTRALRLTDSRTDRLLRSMADDGQRLAQRSA